MNIASIPQIICLVTINVFQLVFTNDPENTYLQVQIKSLSQQEVEKGDTDSFVAVSIVGVL